MIPKKIHYCWFGRNPLPDSAKKCIDSWKKYLPDYEIVEWNEDNFDVDSIPYTTEAYQAHKYAFVSDYARYKIIYEHGGLYFDTDVEIIRPLDAIIANGSFMGIEKSKATKTDGASGSVGINPGMGIGAPPSNEIYKAILDKYASMPFDIDAGTVVKHTTDTMKIYGFDGKNCKQRVGDIMVYPDDYFCPMDSTTGLTHITSNTVSIHHYSCSWMDHSSLSFRLHQVKNKLIKIFGENLIMSVSKLLKH